MKRTLTALIAAALLIAALALPAAAADWTDPDALLPVDIILNQEALEIRKVYDLSPTTDPSTLPGKALIGMAADMSAPISSVRWLSAQRRRR